MVRIEKNEKAGSAKLSIIVPVYNEEKVVAAFLEALKAEAAKLAMPNEIIVVDDASKDGTAKVVGKIAGITFVRQPYNKGYGAAIKAGVRRAAGEYVLFIDGDYEHDPKDVAKLLDHIGQYDMVVGARYKVKLSRLVAKKIISMFANYISGSRIPDLNSGFRVVRKELMLPYLDALPNRFSLTSTLTIIFIKCGYSIKYVPIEVLKRAGKSKIHPIRDFVNFLGLLTKTVIWFSPLKIFMPISAALFVAGFADLAYSVYTSFDVPDSAIFLITSGLIIFFFGLLSDQISAMRLSKSS